MPYTLEHLDGKGIVISYSGHLDENEFRQCEKELVGAVLSTPDLKYVMVDTCNLDASSIDSAMIRESAANASDIGSENQLTSEILFVMPKDLDYGLARVWTAFFTHPGSKCQVFRGREEADAYLKSLDQPVSL